MFGFEFKITYAADSADQAEPKGGFRLFGLRVPWVQHRKNSKGFVLIFVVLS